MTHGDCRRSMMSRLVPRSRRGTLWRFLAAAVAVIGASAAATAVAGLLQVNTIVGYLSQHHGIVTANGSRERQVFARFMAPTPKAKPKAKTTPKSATGHQHLDQIPTAGLTAEPPDGRSQAAQLARLSMPVYFPRLIKAGSSYCLSLTGNCTPADEYLHSYPCGYLIRDQSGRPHPGHRMTLGLNTVLGQYYGIQGTTWKNPPLLASPSATRTAAERKLVLYVNGGSLPTVAWHAPHAVHWISNTLTTDISKQQMVGIAASLTLGRP